MKVWLFLVLMSFCLLSKAQPTVDSLLLGHQKKVPSVYNHPEVKLKLHYNPIVSAGMFFLYFYQKIISNQIGASCAYEPSCSQFCRQGIAKKGFVRGVLLTGDRLQRCTPFNVTYIRAKSQNLKNGKIYDPVQ
ncbi:MAG: membrane protein insertion efficiency factor YidD [Bacteroidia bacterium]|nr:membrane protein insertion efficiency factor YidD [Bacteroidia bacterium]MDW8302383.1 membrane protein insertion efficiency factor YidD [Bacteroidia bacterium]